MRYGLSQFLQKKAKTYASPSLLHMQAPAVRSSLLPGFHPCSTRRAAREAWSMSAIRSVTLHSLQPLPSRLAQGCFSFSLRTLSDPQLKEIRRFRIINPKNKKGRKFKFQADKKARVYKRLVPHRPCFFASFHLMESFLFFPFFFWKNNVVRVFSFK